jgi:hypothetical protein
MQKSKVALQLDALRLHFHNALNLLQREVELSGIYCHTFNNNCLKNYFLKTLLHQSASFLCQLNFVFYNLVFF